ncbi:Nup93/Nic96-domain-containing protein [Umbelopsis sp. PMI_123]|nr:Nup93/Nic96-domain-containing protein [Umbelopsis sp. PMI_123]
MPVTLKQLFEKSQLLTTSVNESELPYIERRLDQIESQSKNLLDETSKLPQKPHDINSRAHFLLANAGVNTHQLVNDLNAIQLDQSLEPVASLYSTDIEGFLRHAHQDTVANVLDDSQDLPGCETVKDILKEQTKGDSKSDVSTGNEEMDGVAQDSWNLPTYTKGSNLLAAIRKRNLQAIAANQQDSKKTEQIDKPQQAKDSSSSPDSKPANVWQLIDRLLAAKSDSRNDPKQIQQNMELVKTSKAFLEEQFLLFVDDTLSKHVLEAKIGGIPSVANRIRGYMNIALKRSGFWTTPRLEVLHDIPIWAYVFFLFRAGRADVALEFVGRNEALFKSEPQFIYYLQEYLADPNHITSKHTRNTILENYRRLCYTGQGSDPYKIALFKILGRCEMYKKNLPEVTPSIEDYLWLQLSTIRELPSFIDSGTELYTLKDLQSLLKQYEPQLRNRSKPNIMTKPNPFIKE